MQSMWRSLCRAGVHSHGSGIIRCFEMQASRNRPGYHREFSSIFRTTAAAPSKYSPPQWSFIAAGHKEQNYKEPKLCHTGLFNYCHSGTGAAYRLITTAVDTDVSVGRDIYVSPSNVNHPTRIKFKRLDKTAKHIMNILDKEAVENVRTEREIANIQPGCIVQMKVEVPENKRRLSVLKGIIIARRNAGLNTTFRLRRLVAGVGVESVFHLYSPNIKEVKILDKKKVRRAKLYYLRDRMNPLKK